MKAAAAALVAILLAAPVAALGGQQPQPRKPLPLKVVDTVDPETAKLKAALGKKISFDFVNTPLRDAVAFMQQVLGVNIIVDPQVDPGAQVTVRVKDMSGGTALQWLARVGGADMRVENGAVYLAPQPKHKVVRRPYAYPGRRIGRAEIRLGAGTTVEIYLHEDDVDAETRKMLITLLQRALAKEAAKAGK